MSVSPPPLLPPPPRFFFLSSLVLVPLSADAYCSHFLSPTPFPKSEVDFYTLPSLFSPVPSVSFSINWHFSLQFTTQIHLIFLCSLICAQLVFPLTISWANFSLHLPYPLNMPQVLPDHTFSPSPCPSFVPSISLLSPQHFNTWHQLFPSVSYTLWTETKRQIQNRKSACLVEN